MKSVESHAVWFGKPEGSSMKITMDNYDPEAREEMIQRFLDQGWLVLYQEHKKKRFGNLSFNYDVFLGFLIGIAVTLVVSSIFNP
jgi:hypothetical protein